MPGVSREAAERMARMLWQADDENRAMDRCQQLVTGDLSQAVVSAYHLTNLRLVAII